MNRGSSKEIENSSFIFSKLREGQDDTLEGLLCLREGMDGEAASGDKGGSCFSLGGGSGKGPCRGQGRRASCSPHERCIPTAPGSRVVPLMCSLLC